MNDIAVKSLDGLSDRIQEMSSRIGENVLYPEQMQSIHDEMIINNVLPGLKLHEPTALLLDVNNLFARARANEFRIDWKKVKTIFENRCDLRYAAAFSAVDYEDEKTVNWVKWMTNTAGFTFVDKSILRYPGSNGKIITKGNMDVEITMAAMKLSSNFTHVILGTCDGDFTGLVEELKSDPARNVSVLGISGNNWNGMSRVLARTAHHFYDMSKIVDFVAFEGNQS